MNLADPVTFPGELVSPPFDAVDSILWDTHEGQCLVSRVMERLTSRSVVLVISVRRFEAQVITARGTLGWIPTHGLRHWVDV